MAAPTKTISFAALLPRVCGCAGLHASDCGAVVGDISEDAMESYMV
jgi:hypothetical protein